MGALLGAILMGQFAAGQVKPTCAPPQVTQGTPVLMDLLVGRAASPAPAQAAPQAEMLAQGQLDSLAQWGDSTQRAECPLKLFPAIALMLRDNPQAVDSRPLFPHFNGALGEWLQQQHSQTTVQTYLPEMIRALIQYAWRYPEDIRAYEWIGDLMLFYPDGQQSRWFSAMAYLRAAYESEGDIREAYETKAIHALEPDTRMERSFDNYRFKKLSEALYASVEENRPIKAPEKVYNPPFDLFSDDVEMPLAAFVNKWQKRENRNAENEITPNSDLTLNADVKASEVKSTVSYNLYALGVIGVVIAAVTFLALKIRKAERERDQS